MVVFGGVCNGKRSNKIMKRTEEIMNGERGVRAGHEGAGLPLITFVETPHTPMVLSP